jgi:hypothetical protein
VQPRRSSRKGKLAGFPRLDRGIANTGARRDGAAHEFIRRLLQHVLPKGFMKVRYYGFLAPSIKIKLNQVELAIHLTHAFELPAKPTPQPARPPPVCRQCGGLLRFYARLRAAQMPAALATGPPGP